MVKNRHSYQKKPKEIQSIIMIAFSFISIVMMLILGYVLFRRFSSFQWDKTIRNTNRLMEQTSEKVEDYLTNMRQVSDTAYYNLIKERDMITDQSEIKQGLNLLYEANRDSLKSIAIYNRFGSLEGSEPIVSQKEDPDVTRQGWFQEAMQSPENMHFSKPHIQNLFDDSTMQYYWVISLSRVIEITKGKDSEMGVLLVDMDCSEIARMLKQINSSSQAEYFYLCNSSGDIICHPRQIEISNGVYKENSKIDCKLEDGTYIRTFEGKKRRVLVNTIGYTGWKLIGVIPNDTLINGMIDMRYFAVMLVVLLVMMLIIVNHVIADKISTPLLRLNQSVIEYEAGHTPDIYVGGSLEVRHLSKSIQDSYEEIQKLMDENVRKEKEKRKSELDALQSQINPHFLYNTLESISWMVEGEKNEEAVFMISQLAKLFRISLSRGHTIISIKEELQHAQSYMNIQKIRYKDTFTVRFDLDESLYSYCTVKLILQPILENAINYGVRNLGDGGEIAVSGVKREDKIFLYVKDNGLGMTEEETKSIFKGNNTVHKKGSGVGLINVNNRIKLAFSDIYGLTVISEPDEGTTVVICLPAIPFTEQMRDSIEDGTFVQQHLNLNKED